MTSVTGRLLDEDDTPIALDELVATSGLTRAEIEALAELGVFESQRGASQHFSMHCIVIARRAARLRSDFELDAAGIALALAYLARIDALQARVRELECQLPH